MKPTRGQWIVIWATVLLALAAWLGITPWYGNAVQYFLESVKVPIAILVVGALLVWTINPKSRK